ncbi:hypothetical protein COU60_03880 [Candidatus Pacearchaeota archaeon CG10_big_fil_rev_8_21_14_0_10_34_76]|nr:MAG: hypothetical protein COU60_03880 [Candidatus Pacearchaeota archaeon CG10_big_fil_rev_8_21_14_0_10_34_76]
MQKKFIYTLIITSLIFGALQITFYSPEINSQSVLLSQGFISYNEYGSGDKNLILIHGGPGSKNDFTLLAPEIKNYKIYSLDMYGFGESEKSVSNYGISSQADVVKEFMDAKNIQKSSILGFSWGGGVAIEFAYKYPESTEKIILLSSMGIQEGEPTGSYLGEKARTIFAYPFVVYYPGAFAGNMHWRKGFIRGFLDSDQRKIRNELKYISSPVLILHGNNDNIVLPWVAEEHHSLISESVLVFYEGSHAKIFSNVTDISKEINLFLANSDQEEGKVKLTVI